MLKAIICGMEHSGTTLLSDLLRQTGKLESGFECGVLMASSPREFPDLDPFYGFMEDGWQISPDALQACCDTDSFDEFYSRLASSAGVVPEGLGIFDKTPRYIAELSDVLARSEAPVIMIHKDPLASVFSDFKRANTTDFDQWLDSYAKPKKRYMRRCYEGYKTGLQYLDRVCSVSLEALCFSARDTCERIFAQVGEPFDIDYLLLKNLRYRNTRAKFVSANIVLEYKEALTRDQQTRIETEFAEFEDWFY
ncbi:sulfotransferase [Henriciella sp. AS95]|uniref:sulfotransferase n=1 Tax=Henriciella sp. AS95 TaxID=3135782 RepID=UPI00317D6BF1